MPRRMNSHHHNLTSDNGDIRIVRRDIFPYRASSCTIQACG